MHSHGFIYISTNKVNGKRYIGLCRYERTKNNIHDYFGSGKAINRAIKKYGKENFSKEVIFEAFDEESLSWAETVLIDEYNAVKDQSFYNMARGGNATGGFLGKKHTEEFKRRRSIELMGHSVTDKVREAVSKTGKVTSQINNSTIVKCPKCGQEGKLPPMKRWHFDNCGKKETIQCPHCGKEGRGGVMKRFHFDNCKVRDRLELNWL